MGDVKLRPRIDQALGRVLDPHFQVSLDDMGMLSSVEEVGDGTVVVRLAFPCLGCPAWEDIHAAVREELATGDGVRNVRVEVDWTEQWSKNRLSSRARRLLADVGVQV